MKMLEFVAHVKLLKGNVQSSDHGQVLGGGEGIAAPQGGAFRSRVCQVQMLRKTWKVLSLLERLGGGVRYNSKVFIIQPSVVLGQNVRLPRPFCPLG